MKNMANKIINVLIVDDEQIVREGLRYIIDWNTLGFCICGEAANGEDALEMIRQYRPGLVLLDIRMSGMLGTELMEKARSEGFSGAFIILSGYSDFKYAQTALQFGARTRCKLPVSGSLQRDSTVISVLPGMPTLPNNRICRHLSTNVTRISATGNHSTKHCCDWHLFPDVRQLDCKARPN